MKPIGLSTIRPIATMTWPYWLIASAVLLLVIPSYVTLAGTTWSTDEQGHGPVILAVTLWLMWSRRQALFDLPDNPSYLLGWGLFVFSLVLYVIGRSQQVDTLEVLAHLPLVASLLLLSKGRAGLRWGAFSLFFLIFMIPLPGLIVQALTSPLKIAVSHVAEALMYSLGFPVARSGVILFIGQYQLLVADACAGLNSMFTLEALGLLYMNLMNHTSVRRNIVLAVLIVPISFASNVIRVMVLVLVTYYFGDAVGQGFVHGFAGMLLFMVALSMMLAVDKFIDRFFRRQEPIVIEGAIN